MGLAFVDMDEVLVDFVSGAIRVHRLPVDPTKVTWDFWTAAGMTDRDFWAPLGFTFWKELKPTLECKELMATVLKFYRPQDVFVCSSPCRTLGCVSGKAAWVEEHFPEFVTRLLLTGRKEILAGPGRVLIDDSPENCRKWVYVGGDACMVPRHWNDLGSQGLPVVETVLRRLERLNQS